ncbi:hypothetical protein EVAR_103481_1 [Eumeta japonica]|uniref:Uncharacterized protein n=1 Tax=Eumeta variegata TaxID=151549 RepID=A0A4C1ZIV8_EUMVA|nr:hypothetical protein EVAR_103481_1 [Eumeta japonica]
MKKQEEVTSALRGETVATTKAKRTGSYVLRFLSRLCSLASTTVPRARDNRTSSPQRRRLLADPDQHWDGAGGYRSKPFNIL